jgi:outer membrane protein assembly factor BamD
MRSLAFAFTRAVWPALLAVGLGGALTGCEEQPAKTALGYTEDAKRAYDAAMEEFKAHNWIEAQTLFREVKRKYSYSKWARQAELRIADADMEQEKYSDATREYKDFIHAHRADTEDVEYARSKIAEATYAEIPESLLLPAAEERDQAAVVDAYKELRSYLGDYPESKESTHMRELLAAVTARLVRHELYVARFYLKKDNYEAAVARIQYALRNYGASVGGPSGLRTEASGLEAEALLLLGTTYLQMHKWPDARQAFEAIVKGYVQSPIAEQAKNYLGYMRQRGV